MQVPAANLAKFALPDRAYAVLREVAHSFVEVVDFEDRHVATVAAHPVEQTARRGSRGDGRDDFEELVADAEEGVVESEFSDTRVAEANVDIEVSTNVGDRCIEVASNECYLAEPDHLATLTSRFWT